MNNLVDFEIRKIKNNEIYFICSTFYNIHDFEDEINKYLNKINFNGSVIVDRLLIDYEQDSNTRFIKYPFINNKIDIDAYEYLNLDKSNIYRQITSEYFASILGTRQEIFLLPSFMEKLAKGEIL